MTDVIVKDCETSDLRDVFASVRTGLTGTTNADPNIEEYLTRIRTLAEVSRQSSFGGLDHSALVGLDRQICNAIARLADVSFPGIDSTAYHHLAAWIRGITRLVPAELFTTNYDLLLEEALEELRVPYFDGFIGSREAFFDPYAIESEEEKLPPRWARLWKLHGSINWWASPAVEPSKVVRSRKEAGECLLVHPSHLKYDESRQMPYLAMMDRLKAFLRRPAAVLVTCGYSFGDRHINVLIRQALAGNADAAAFALLRSPLEKYAEARKAAFVTPNLTLVAKDRAVIGTREAPWGTRGAPDKLPHGVRLGAPSPGAVGNASAEVLLGNFAELGMFLQEMIGGIPPTVVQINGPEEAGSSV